MTEKNLAERLLDVAVIRGDFLLSSGRRSGFYVDKYRFLCRPDLLKQIAAELCGRLPEDVERIAAVEGGASIVVTAMSLESGIEALIVRKGRKGYGTDNWCEGSWRPGMKVVLVEDVVTTGAQMAVAEDALRSGGLDVVGLFAVVNRGGGEGFTAKVDAIAILTKEDMELLGDSGGESAVTGLVAGGQAD